MRHVALGLMCVALGACATPSTERTIQAALDGAVLACQTLLNSPEIPAEPEARAWCQRLVAGCQVGLP